MTYSLRIYLYIQCCLLVISSSAQSDIENCSWTIFTFEDGKISSEGCLVNGKPEGEWNTFFEDGILKSRGTRVNFELEGVWEFYNPNGTIQKRVEFEVGSKNGREWNFSEEGILLTEKTFEKGVQVGNELVFCFRRLVKKKEYLLCQINLREWLANGKRMGA